MAPVSSRTLTVAVVTPFEVELVESIRAVGDGIDVRYEPDLFPAVRYPATIVASTGSGVTPTRSGAGNSCSGGG